MELENYIIGIIVFSMVVGVLGLAISDLNANYGTTVDDSWVGLYDKLNETRTNIESMEGQLVSNASVLETDSYIDFFAGGFKAIMGIFQTIPLAFNIITTITVQFGVPPIIFWSLTSILLVLIIFAIIKLLRSA